MPMGANQSQGRGAKAPPPEINPVVDGYSQGGAASFQGWANALPSPPPPQ